MNTYTIALTTILAVVFCTANAQTDTTRTVTITDYTNKYISTTNYTLDSCQKNLLGSASVSLLLQNVLPTYTKTYSVGGSSIVSMRGLYGQHTALVWNGININSATLGVADISLLSSQAVQKISVYTGNSAPRFGSGASGGTILLQNNIVVDTSQYITISSEVGSYGHQQHQAAVQYSTKKWYAAVQGTYLASDNNFKYITIEDSIKNRTYNKAQSHNLSTQLAYILSPKHRFAIYSWKQFANRNIPASLIDVVTQSNQVDDKYLNMFHYEGKNNNHVNILKIAYIYEDMVFSSPALAIPSHIITKKSWLHYQHQYKYKKQDLCISLEAKKDLASNTNYAAAAAKQTTLTASIYHIYFINKKCKLISNFRSEKIDKLIVPIVVHLNAHYSFSVHNTLSASVSTTYRNPTLNDKFWVPGGNPLLKAESGKSAEITWQSIYPQKTLPKVTFITTFFVQKIKNLIRWQPQNTGWWSPVNQDAVNSYGVESKLNIHYTFHKIQLQYNQQWQYQQVKNQYTDKFLPYSYAFSTLQQLGVYHKNLAIQLQYNYQGKKYIATDNSSYLPAFGVMNVQFCYQKSMNKQFLVRCYTTLQNVTNSSYQLVPWYPMPLRTLQLKVELELK